MSVSIQALTDAQLGEAQALLLRACQHDDLEGLARETLFEPGARALVAQPLGVFDGSQLAAVACTSGQWLRLLATDPEFRNRGIGSELLARCEAQIAAHASFARTLDQPGNYLSPGIDASNVETLQWLGKRGYEPCGTATNLLIEVQHNARVSAQRMSELRQRCEAAGYQLERMPAARLEADAQIIGQNFSEGWQFEVTRAAQRSEGVHIAVVRDTGELAAFAAHDGNNAGQGWFGPTGTLPAHRGRGLGGALLMACLLDIQAAGHSHCQVAWIGPRAFYDKIAGIERERQFTVLRKELS